MNTSFSNHTTVTSDEVSLQPLGVLTDVVAECVAELSIEPTLASLRQAR